MVEMALCGWLVDVCMDVSYQHGRKQIPMVLPFAAEQHEKDNVML